MWTMGGTLPPGPTCLSVGATIQALAPGPSGTIVVPQTPRWPTFVRNVYSHATNETQHSARPQCRPQVGMHGGRLPQVVYTKAQAKGGNPLVKGAEVQDVASTEVLGQTPQMLGLAALWATLHK